MDTISFKKSDPFIVYYDVTLKWSFKAARVGRRPTAAAAVLRVHGIHEGPCHSKVQSSIGHMRPVYTEQRHSCASPLLVLIVKRADSKQ